MPELESTLDPLLPERVKDTITSSESFERFATTPPLNEILEHIPTTNKTLQVFETAITKLGDAHPLAKAVLTALSVPYNLLKSEREFDISVKDLAYIMHLTCKCLLDLRYHAVIMSAMDLFVSIMSALREAALFMDLNRVTNTLAQSVRAQFPRMLEGFGDNLVKKKNEFQITMIIQIARDASMIASMTSDDFLQKHLNPVKGNFFAEGCLRHTRVGILQQVREWRNDYESEKNILWIVGGPGAGKSTIATTIAKELAEEGLFCATFFCKRDIPDLRDSRQVWPTLAYSLANEHYSVKAALMRVLLDRMGGLRHYSVLEQFQELIKGPLETARRETRFRSYKSPYPLVIIDALDECYPTNDGDSEWERLLNSLEQWAGLPSCFKLIITSRDLHDIHKTLGKISRRLDITTGDNVLNESKEDVRTFFIQKFATGMIKDLAHIPSDWPGDTQIQMLTDYAAGLFLWADMIIRYVGTRTGGTHAVMRLDNVVGVITKQERKGVEFNQVDCVFAEILLGAFLHCSPDERKRGMSCLAAIALAKESLRESDLVELLSTESSGSSGLAVYATLRALSSIISPSAIDGKLHVCHNAVWDLVLSRERSEAAMEFSVKRWNDRMPLLRENDPHSLVLDCDLESKRLALACLRLIHRTLSKDVNSIVEVLKQSNHMLRYARLHWLAHLTDADVSRLPSASATVPEPPNFKGLANEINTAVEVLTRFAEQPVLLDIEVEDVIKRMREAIAFAKHIAETQQFTNREVLDFERHVNELYKTRGKFEIAMVICTRSDVPAGKSK